MSQTLRSVKRIAVFVLVLCIVLSLTGCNSYRKAIKLYTEGYNDGKYYEGNVYKAQDKIYDAWLIFHNIPDYKDAKEWEEKCLETVLGDRKLFSAELEEIRRNKEFGNGERVPMIDYNSLKKLATEKGEPIICEDGNGGYYDDLEHRAECVDEDYWYDPLDKSKHSKKEVGFQHVTVKYLMAGDFAVRIEKRVFPDTKGEADTLWGNLYCKGEEMNALDSYQEITDFLKVAKTGSTYLYEDRLYALQGEKLYLFTAGSLYEINKL